MFQNHKQWTNIFSGLVLGFGLTFSMLPMNSHAQDAQVMETLRHSTPQQIEKGKQIFATQCMACHGLEGKGDGPAAIALNPKPRDFTSGTWTKGGSPAQVFVTVSNGISGTPMPAFASLSVEDRWGLVHFVRSLSPNTPSDTPETLALIGLGESGGAASALKKEKPELPIDFIMDRMVQEAKK